MSVAELQELEEVKSLLLRGRQAGVLTYGEVATALAEVELDEGDIEDLHAHLEKSEIELVEEIDPALTASTQVERAPDKPGRRKKATIDLKSDMTTDSLQLFFKDIGKVRLLTAQKEVDLAKVSGSGTWRDRGWVGLSSLTGSPGDTGAVMDRNVLGAELEPCGSDPVTGFYRDGCCHTGPEDRGSHTICAVATAEFLEHQLRIGNDLSTPMPEYHFPGLAPGDRWCVTAVNWLRAHEDGAAAYVVLASTHERALEIVPLAALQQRAVDVPGDPSILGD